jgi:hypothetical protein
MQYKGRKCEHETKLASREVRISAMRLSAKANEPYLGHGAYRVE